MGVFALLTGRQELNAASGQLDAVRRELKAKPAKLNQKRRELGTVLKP
jgi:uncharacterized protein (DUF3084 family)